MSDNNVDLQQFKRALSCFATGVAVVTTLDSNGEKIGVTVSSFNSVSLNPPLVLWSIAHESKTYSVFTAAEYFAVNVLSLHQGDLAARFAKRGGDKFEGLDCHSGLHGVPLLPDYAACFECETENVFDGGDHKIIVGRVLGLDDRESDPLIFYRGRYLEKNGSDSVEPKVPYDQ
jgi:3-hydroxy-9,10-secoandrosta-1,3,5(10)-triene-9,17-dione monooxygenase reductase component